MPNGLNEWMAFSASILFVGQWILILWLCAKENRGDDDNA